MSHAVWVRVSFLLDHDNGARGYAYVGMDGRATAGRIEGSMRAYWQFLRDGWPYLVCDSGSVSFRAGSLDKLAG